MKSNDSQFAKRETAALPKFLMQTPEEDPPTDPPLHDFTSRRTTGLQRHPDAHNSTGRSVETRTVYSLSKGYNFWHLRKALGGLKVEQTYPSREKALAVCGSYITEHGGGVLEIQNEDGLVEEEREYLEVTNSRRKSCNG